MDEDLYDFIPKYEDMSDEEKAEEKKIKESFQEYLDEFVQNPPPQIPVCEVRIPVRWPEMMGLKEAYVFAIICAYINGDGFSHFKEGELEKLSCVPTKPLQRILSKLVKLNVLARCTYDLRGYHKRIKHLVPIQYGYVYAERVLNKAPCYLKAFKNFFNSFGGAIFYYPVDRNTLSYKWPPPDLSKKYSP